MRSSVLVSVLLLLVSHVSLAQDAPVEAPMSFFHHECRPGGRSGPRRTRWSRWALPETGGGRRCGGAHVASLSQR